ncbi:hypothetical protein BAUCODRAFT_536463 [Baudoinia panamericana UAMH 10762]|uniref:Uncharacterized protein n=1 Tax=Baudoinia panamericana (strain UAMH 10762) TaxID=717646 RepID=M2LLX8_BAUPA|nr:uncharacterized protein BAUCODRAFT_536463 [Baudoinia panamericana UAMH 10762]EMC95322.1 hypothetical protein BAUCODRAFT_536463 [Baudoinia panamericana UAMH 10762]
MDIQHWLEHTADREPPPASDEAGLPDFIQPRSEPGVPARKYRRKRRRESSDSSLLDLQRAYRPLATNHAPPSHAAHDPDNASGSSRSRYRSGSSRHDPVRTKPKTYERRARHKSKPDRYEPNSKHKRKERNAGNVKPKRRKSRRSGDGGRTAGLVSAFQLKTGPKRSRLTLSAEAHGGLFRHGRASAQIAGRGSGLPDLVFNELRFLQRPKDHQDESIDMHEPHPSRKGRERRRDGTISAYFAAKRLDLATAAQNKLEEHACAELRDRTTRGSTVIRAPVELPDKPFLGFGSKGRPTDSTHTAPQSNSCYTWSASVVPLTEQAEPGLEAQQTIATVARSKHGDEYTSVKAVPPRLMVQRKLVSPVPRKEQRRRSMDRSPGSPEGHCRQTRRVRRPAVVEVHKPPGAPSEQFVDRAVPGDKTVSQSLTHYPSSGPGRVKPNHAKGKHWGPEPAGYHTSDILSVQPWVTGGPDAAQQDQPPHSMAVPLLEKENIDPRSFTPTSKLLKRAWDAVQPSLRDDPHEDAETTRRPGVVMRPNQKHGAAAERLTPIPARSAIRNELQTNRERISALPERRLGIVNALRPRSRRQVILPSTTYKDRPSIYHHAYVHRHGASATYDEEMLDNLNDEPTLSGLANVFGRRPRTEHLVRDTTSHLPAGFFQAQAEHTISADLEPLASGEPLAARRTPSVHGLSILNEFRSDRSAFLLTDDADESNQDFAGFWRPHRLY